MTNCPRKAHPVRRLAVLCTVACASGPAGAAADAVEPSALRECAIIERNADRLACYDRLVAPERAPAAALQRALPAGDAAASPRPAGPQPPAPAPALSALPVPPVSPDGAAGSRLTRHWELEAATQRGAFGLRAHRPNYLLPAYYTSARNDAPFQSPSEGAGTARPFDRTEFMFQLGFKMKLAQDVLGSPADLWLGYTQQSWWQAYNRARSSPFRETNYQPELMLVVPTRYEILGLQGRFVNLGLVHQSNGRSAPLSRSWNRVYAQVGLERGEFSLLLRPWYRLRESRAEDDNPDITDYLGHGDLAAAYHWRGHVFSALARRNFRTDRGAVQLDWAFPLSGALKGYVQLFSGYGASLIDYNYRQTTIGVGVLIGPRQQ